MIKNKDKKEMIALKVDLKMPIREFKQYVLAKNERKPFFLEFHMDNSQLLKELLEKSENEIIKIFTNMNIFDAKCINHRDAD